MTDDIEMTTTASSGNVFADLGLPDAEDLLAKANLALHIRHAIEVRKLTQVQAAKIMGLDQPKVSSIINGRLEGYSTDRLMRFLNDLGCDVQIHVSAPHPDTRGYLRLA
ncbi:MAG: helix-turn-helix domain-containing protein [Asticcacaulis sp.]|nr:helix-turn-helix domain-containing protein [Asticcacaulis sp.]